ncbi:MAG: acyltransferase [Chloroflexi bacterium]|nr:acyltransferase [Chloroflexota bacterium]
MGSEISAKEEHPNIWLERVHRRKRRFEQLKELGKWWWWAWITMQCSNLPYIGRLFARLAGLSVGPYRSRRALARIKTYISPKAQIHCSDLHIGPKCFIDDFVTIFGTDGSVVLDKRVCLYQGTIVEVGQGGKVIIGENTHVFPGCNLNGYVGEVRIGRQVMISAGCGFTPYQHKLDDLSRPMSDQPLTSKGDIVIEDDVWLGMGVKVMDGVRIGRGAVVGANAVVTKDIPPYSIAVGVPARVIRKREAAR